MSGREFFLTRYRELGWNYEPVTLTQAIRVNTMNASRDEAVARLESRGIGLEKIPFLPDGYWIRSSAFSVGATSEYLLGLYSIQEAAAQVPAALFTKLKDKKVLDACAAPGGKTVQLADLMQSTGLIFALDVEKRRLTALCNQLERCRARNVIVRQMDARQASSLEVKFDRVLVDAPCSGNFAADRQWFCRRTIKDVERNAMLQREILSEAVKALRDDGEMVYSTCSLEPEENELNVDWAMKNLDLEPVETNCLGEGAPTSIFGKELDSLVKNCKRIWPGQTQGFFVCKLKKRVSAQ